MKAFSDRGHKVTIFVIRPEKKSPSVSTFKDNSIDVFEIHPPSYTPFSGKKGVGKYVNYLLCNSIVYKTALELMKKIQLILSTHTCLALEALILL